MSVADIASLASSAAVLVSLLFLAVQVRQSNRNQRSLMQQGRTTRNVDLLFRLADPNLSGLWVRIGDGGTLEDSEYYMLYGYMASVFWSYEDSFFQFRSGMLDAQSWASDLATLKRLLSNPAYRAVWRAVRGAIGDEYRSFLDGLMVEARNNPPPPNLAAILKQFIAEERNPLTKTQATDSAF
jgi:hypothetical protein